MLLALWVTPLSPPRPALILSFSFSLSACVRRNGVVLFVHPFPPTGNGARVFAKATSLFTLFTLSLTLPRPSLCPAASNDAMSRVPSSPFAFAAFQTSPLARLPCKAGLSHEMRGDNGSGLGVGIASSASSFTGIAWQPS
jgi:hypothetical protein